jgi:hypothetical protein
VCRLASRGIRLLRSDWESKFKHQAGTKWPADAKHKVYWTTNSDFAKLERKK